MSYQSFGEFARFLSALRNPASLESRPAPSVASAFGRKSLQVFAISFLPHPHWHVLVLEGGFIKYDRFVYLPIGADVGMLKVWQDAILSLFLRKDLIVC